MIDSFKPLLARLADGGTLSEEDADGFFAACLRGEPTPAQIGAAVTAMRMRGETVGEITACARAMRRTAVMLDHPYEVIDTCGTGGDGLHTYNISTAAALIAAGCGLKVAKHGTRALSSRSGSSDVLTALGVNIAAGPDQQRRCLDEAGICFLFAPAHHGAMRHVLPVRAELVLGALGSERAWVMHGSGMDEITTTGETRIAEWREGQLRLFTVTPEAVGLRRAGLAELQGGDPAENAVALRELVAGKTGAYRDIAALGAASALVVAEKAETLREGLLLAFAAIDDGRVQAALDRLIEVTQAP
jgi:anthranilate phosphoribosyltransferase